MAKNDLYPDPATVMNTHAGARASTGSVTKATLDDLLGRETNIRKLPEDLESWLAGLRLLEHLPFHYLVPDARLLPPESVRFFHLDRTWTDRLVEGAMSAGVIGTGEMQLAGDVAAAARAQLDEASGSYGEEITGFLLRSTLVRRWPRMEIRAYRLEGNVDTTRTPMLVPSGASARKLTNLRIARLSESILLVLWHGVPNYVEIQEPKHGVQFGVNPNEEDTTLNVEPRNLETGQIMQDGGSNLEITAQARSNSVDGVVDIDAIADELASAYGVSTTEVSSRHMAMTLQQMPFVQPFRAGGVRGEDYYPDRPPQEMEYALARTVPLFAAFAEGKISAADAVATAQLPVATAMAAAFDSGLAFFNEDKDDS